MGGIITSLIVTIIVGIALIIIGVLNTKGNVSMLHSYHTKRVKEEDKIPFGRRVGFGSIINIIIIGISLIIFGVFLTLSELLKTETYLFIGMGFMFSGIVIGTTIMFHAMIKYNKGIF